MAPRTNSRAAKAAQQPTGTAPEETTPQDTATPEETGTAGATDSTETPAPQDTATSDSAPQDPQDPQDPVTPEDGDDAQDADDEPEPEWPSLLPLLALTAGGRATREEFGCIGLLWTMLNETTEGEGFTVRDVMKRADDVDHPEVGSEQIKSVMRKLARIGMVIELENDKGRDMWVLGRPSDVLRALLPADNTMPGRVSPATSSGSTVSATVTEPTGGTADVWLPLAERGTDGDDKWPNPLGRDTTLAFLRAHPGQSFTKTEVCKQLDTKQSGSIGAALNNHVVRGRAASEGKPMRYRYVQG